MNHELPYNRDKDDDAEHEGGGYRKDASTPPRFRAPILPPTVRPELHASTPLETTTPPQREVWLPLNQSIIHETTIKHGEADDDDEEDEERDDKPRTSKSQTAPAQADTSPPKEHRAEQPEDAAVEASAEKNTEDDQPTQPAPVAPTAQQPEFAPATQEQAEQEPEGDDAQQTAVAGTTPHATLPPLPPLEAPDIPRPYIPPVAEQQAFTQPAETIPTLQVPEQPSIWQPEAASPFVATAPEKNTDDDVSPLAAGGGSHTPTASSAATSRYAAAANQPPHPAMMYGHNVAPSSGGNAAPNYGYNNYTSAPNTYAPTAERQPMVEARDRRVSAVAVLLGAEYFMRRRMGRQIRKEMQELAERQHHDILTAAAKNREQQEVLANEQRRHTQEMQDLRSRQEQERSAAALPLTYGAEQTMRRPSAPFEMPRQQVRHEQGPVVPVAVPERSQAPAAEQAEGAQLSQQEAQPRQHVEQDAWRRYVVDEHGREVTGAIEYGKAYHQERQQEIRRDLVADDAAGLAAASVGGVVMHGQNVQHPTLPSGLTNTALPQGKPTIVDPQHRLPAPDAEESFSSNLTNPWFWVMLILIVAAFFTAALI